MIINSINIYKSKQSEKLIFKQGNLEKIFELLYQLIFIIAIPYFFGGLELYNDLINNKPIEISITFVISFFIACLLLLSLINLNSLKRIKGLSADQNSQLILKIAENNNWNIFINNQQITIIKFTWLDTGTDWGKQMTILYDGTDILVNCNSFGLFSSPSPFHWFGNKRKVNKLKTEFENEIKNVLQQCI